MEDCELTDMRIRFRRRDDDRSNADFRWLDGQVKYTLRAVFMTDLDQQWLYFKTSTGWWYNRGGNVQKVSGMCVAIEK